MADLGFWDIHTHILPGMDDGCRDVGESISVLEEEIHQCCEGIIATPHYYADDEPVDSFLERREAAFKKLQEAVTEHIPSWSDRILLGAEVAYHESLMTSREIKKLCLGASDYILVEMPFREWSDKELKNIRLLRNYHGLRPIIAHLERYRKFVSKKRIDELINQDVIIQINAGMFEGIINKTVGIKWLREGKAHVIASDTHNRIKRPPNIQSARTQILGKDEKVWEMSRKTSERIWVEANGGTR